jgi:ankyrin repeat protein
MKNNHQELYRHGNAIATEIETQKKNYYLALVDLCSSNQTEAALIDLIKSRKSYAVFRKTDIIFDLITTKRFLVLEYLITKSVKLDYTSPSGANILHVACGANGSLQAVRFVTEKTEFTDINKKTDIGETPFLLAIMYEHKNILNYFFDRFLPDLQITTIYGENAESLAQKTGNRSIIHLISKHIKRSKPNGS